MSELITRHKRKHVSSFERSDIDITNKRSDIDITNKRPRRRPHETPDVTRPPEKITPVDNKDGTNKLFDIILLNLLATQDTPSNNDPPDNSNPPVLPSSVDDPRKNLPCCNPLCDHDSESTSFKMFEIDKIESSRDLINLGKSFHCKKNLVYRGINLRLLCNIVEPLTELNNMVGLNDVKNKIVNHIMFFLRGYHTKERCNNCVDCSFDMPCTNNRSDMLHTVITGPPGVGKTQVARIIGKIYCNMGILSKGTFTEVGREDLVAKYLGQTAIKTKLKIAECTGGVMFIDEVYALGEKTTRDSFAKECIDTLNRSLSNITDLLCIVAGYEKDIDKCFFAFNPGLRRRFTFSYNIESYTASELYEIFCLKVKSDCWTLNLSSDDVMRLKRFFRDKYNYFPSFGGDMETLFLQCKISHSRNTCINNSANTRELSFNDIQDGFKNFSSNRKYSEQTSAGVFTS